MSPLPALRSIPIERVWLTKMELALLKRAAALLNEIDERTRRYMLGDDYSPGADHPAEDLHLKVANAAGDIEELVEQHYSRHGIPLE